MALLLRRLLLHTLRVGISGGSGGRGAGAIHSSFDPIFLALGGGKVILYASIQCTKRDNNVKQQSLQTVLTQDELKGRGGAK